MNQTDKGLILELPRGCSIALTIFFLLIALAGAVEGNEHMLGTGILLGSINLLLFIVGSLRRPRGRRMTEEETEAFFKAIRDRERADQNGDAVHDTERNDGNEHPHSP